MKNWTIGKRIVLMASLLCALSVVISVWSIAGMSRLQRAGLSVSEKSLPGVIQTSTMNYLPMINMVRLYRLMDPITGDEKKAIEEATLEDTRKFRAADKIYADTMTTPAERAEYEKLGRIHANYLDLRSQYLAAVETNRDAARKILTVDMVAALNEFSAQTLSILKQNADDGAANGKQLVASARATSISLIGVSVLGVILGAGLALFTVYHTNKRLKEVAGALNDAARQVEYVTGQVATASESFADRANQQAASLEETSASVEEINSQTKHNAENAETARSLSEDARSSTEDGTRKMQEMVAAMSAIKASSDNIAKIIKTIDEIAFQTNILALNAAVEAARAGDAGAGFAVVAEEVRNLAQRAAQAARETAAKIEDSIVKSTRGAELSARVSEGLQQIAEKARKVNELVGNIAASSKEQAQGLAQIGSAVTEMDRGTQANAAGAEETASASAEMKSQASALLKNVEALMQLVGGAGGGSRPSEVTAPVHPQSAVVRGTPLQSQVQNGRLKNGATKPAVFERTTR
jgi:methyl-accepting chemotaxis protein